MDRKCYDACKEAHEIHRELRRYLGSKIKHQTHHVLVRMWIRSNSIRLWHSAASKLHIERSMQPRGLEFSKTRSKRSVILHMLVAQPCKPKSPATGGDWDLEKRQKNKTSIQTKAEGSMEKFPQEVFFETVHELPAARHTLSCRPRGHVYVE